MPTLNWIGKDKVINHHLDVPFRTLVPSYSFGNAEAAKDNLIIHGDNLEALKALLPQYEGKVKLIYIDPPYNTGNEGWIYNDNVNDPKIKKWLGEVVGKEGEDLSRHDKWLCMMYPRLKLLHKLLSEDGSIWISIDDNEQGLLRLLLDEIFGQNNFINNIIWEKKYSPQNDARWLSDSHDFIITYAKNKTIWIPNLLPRTDEMNARYKNLDNDVRGVWKSSDLSVKTYNAATDYPITTPSGRIVNPPKGYCWRVSKAKFQEMLDDKRIWFGPDGSNVPSIKRFLSDVQDGMVSKTLWFREEIGDNQEAKQDLKNIFFESSTPFDTPKPTRLIQRILQIASDPDSIILDSFAGSGTTAHAVLKLNQEDDGHRKFIMIEMEDYAETITAERVRRVINGYGAEGKEVSGTGGGFSYLTLGPAVFTAEGALNPEVEDEALRQYIWYAETKSSLPAKKLKNKYHLGSAFGVSYYFYYIKGQETILDFDFLKTVKDKDEQYVIYADLCAIDSEYLKSRNIAFKKIPRDIPRY
jgi:adenine-specific DNA-methyltransferase